MNFAELIEKKPRNLSSRSQKYSLGLIISNLSNYKSEILAPKNIPIRNEWKIDPKRVLREPKNRKFSVGQSEKTSELFKPTQNNKLSNLQKENILNVTKYSIPKSNRMHNPIIKKPLTSKSKVMNYTQTDLSDDELI